jgi:predicted ferric reductase
MNSMAIIMLQDIYRHNPVLIVASGVGIPPYLSLLSASIGRPRNHELKVHFHWICRKKWLIDFLEDKCLST